jgi:hypothetical protein
LFPLVASCYLLIPIAFGPLGIAPKKPTQRLPRMCRLWQKRWRVPHAAARLCGRNVA